MELVHSSSIELFYVGTFVLNQDQQLKLNIHVKSVRRMFTQIRMPCETWSHAKCLGFTNTQFNYYLGNPHIDWICNWCCLPFKNCSDQEFNADYNTSNEFEILAIIQDQEEEYANNSRMNPTGDVLSRIITSRQKDCRKLLLWHLNINSIQNKFEEVKILVNQLKAQVIFLTETKIDSTYPNSQFKLDGFNLYRQDRRKGGGGIMAFFSSSLITKRLQPPRKYDTFESLVIKSKFGNYVVTVLGLYRPPKAVSGEYAVKLENDLHDILAWATFQTNFVVITGDLNLDRLKPQLREGKVLCDLEDVYGLSCLISKPTRITEKSHTLLDVI